MKPFQSQPTRQSTPESETHDSDRNPQKPSSKTSKLKQHDDFRIKALPHLDALYRYAGIINLSEQEIEELIQESYLLTYADFQENNHETDIKTQLFATLQNIYDENFERARDSVRRSAKGQSQSYETLLNEASLGIIEGLDETFISNISTDEIQRTFDTLPERYLVCVTLVDVDNFNYDQISTILNRSRETVVSQINRGRKIIKKKFVKNAMEEGTLPSD